LISRSAWVILLAILARMLLAPPVADLSRVPGGRWPTVSPAGTGTLAGASGPGGAGSLDGAGTTMPEGRQDPPSSSGYPYASATCEFGAAGGAQCANPRDLGDLFDWGYAGSAGRPFRASDPWGYEYRNCTSYIAWRLSRAGVPASLFRDLGNASQWVSGVTGKRGVVVNQTPSPGAIAVWVVSAGVGHVAWVDSVRPGAASATVTVSDYNYAGTGAFATHLVTSPPSDYIHFPGV
jgi:surface antigen